MNIFDLAYRSKSAKHANANANADMDSFAKNNFNVHKRGILRKKITIHTMLSWTREPIRKPMIMTKDKQVGGYPETGLALPTFS